MTPSPALPLIVVLDAATMRGGLQKPSFPHEWIAYETTTPAQAPKRARKADIIVTNKAKISAACIRSAPRLKLICVAATGVDCVDIAECKRRKVRVCNVRDYAGRGVAEHVLMLILSLARNLPQYRERTLAGEWASSPVFSPQMGEIENMEGKQLGVIGGGALGRSVAALAECAGMRAVFLKRQRQADDLPRAPWNTLLAESDIISLHCPLTENNRGLFGARAFAQMKPGALFINTARGGLVQNGALIHALKSGKLAGAGIDTLEKEPPPANHPLLVFRHPRLIVTPHIAWASRQSLREFRRQLLANMESFASGKLQNVVV